MGVINPLITVGCHLANIVRLNDLMTLSPFCDDTLCYTTGNWCLGNTLLEPSFSAFAHLFSSLTPRHDGWHEHYDEPHDVHDDAADAAADAETGRCWCCRRWLQ